LQYIAVKAMDPNAIPLLLTVAGLGTSTLWLAYGVLKSNVYVTVPNVLGVFLNIVQLAVGGYVTYRVRSGYTALPKGELTGAGMDAAYDPLTAAPATV